MKIGFLGPRGTFSQQATEIYAQGLEVELVQYENIRELILAVNRKEIMEAVVPIENSIEGAVNITLDMLAWDVGLMIKKEINIPITHNFMMKDVNANIACILSHPQAIGQCGKFLHRYFPDVPIKYTYSTAQAAEQVALQASDNQDGQYGAIAAEKAAQEYGINIIHRNIQDYGNNVTRFIVLAHHDDEFTQFSKDCKLKTSMVFSTENKPGSLYKVLQILNLWDINMTRIESRPAKDSLGSYIFFVDIEGHREDDNIKDALLMIEKKTSFFKMLGSYCAVQPNHKVQK